jgi:hypothetical protein
MTLVSPGVQISIIDQSNYLPAATNSVPYILVATAQNKIGNFKISILFPIYFGFRVSIN